MGKSDVRIVAHPAVPVAAAEPGRFDLDDDAIGSRLRIGDGLDRRRFAELLEDDSFHRSLHAISLF